MVETMSPGWNPAEIRAGSQIGMYPPLTTMTGPPMSAKGDHAEFVLQTLPSPNGAAR